MSARILLAMSATAALLSTSLAQTLANETVLGVYMFHRHGDRTAKSTPPANLTDLGYQMVYTSGQYYRNRYIAANAPYQIHNINNDIVKQSQISVSAPLDTVLQNSATGFLQGLYPPVGSGLDTETLRNGTVVTAPMQGYQLIPVQLVSTGSGSEDNGWLQSASGCAKATISSNDFFQSAEYMSLFSSTHDFYTGLTNTTNGVFNQTQMSFLNAYTSMPNHHLVSCKIPADNVLAVFDLLNVAEIHNATIPNSDLLSNDTLCQLRTLADTHEWGLAYNSSDNMRAIAGKTLAGQIVQFLNSTLTGKGAQKINIQFGAYGTFASFFGLAIPDIETVNPNLMGVADYASNMMFELFTNGSTSVSSANYPTTGEDVYVRFLFHNGTTSNTSEPVAYPLFGSGQEAVSWNDFATQMDKFAIGSTEQWCTACGNLTGTCAAYAPSGSGSSSSSTSSGTSSSAMKSGNGLSPAVNGVIGAMVTLAVVLGLEALAMVVFGLRLARKNRLAGGAANGGSGAGGETVKA